MSILIVYIVIYIISSIYSLNIKIGSDNDRCIIENLSHEYNLVNYNIEGLSSLKKQDKEIILKGIVFKIYHIDHDIKNKELIHSEYIKSEEKGKFALLVKDFTNYMICISVYGGYNQHKIDLSIGISITSEYTDNPDLSKALRHHHVEDMHYTLLSAINNIKKAVDGHNEESYLEDEDAHRINKSSYFYFRFTLFQIFAILLLFMYQLFKGWNMYKEIINNELNSI